VLQLLQSRRPPNAWLLKAPAHNFHLDSLFAVYPDARVIVTHRDPAKVAPSALSVILALQPPTASVDIDAFGRHLCEHLRIGTERALAARNEIGQEHFLDVQHQAFVTDPFGTIEQVYDFLGRAWRPSVKAKMQRWYRSNRSGAHGTHTYSAERFGLTATQIRRDFDAYITRHLQPQ
jgi:Sulfotransferase family